jgi:hypothetical protein
MTAPVSGTSHAEQSAQAVKKSSDTDALKARRAKINDSQEERAEDLELVVDKQRNASDFSDSTKVKLSKALSSFLAESHTKEISAEPVDGKTDNQTQANNIKRAQQESDKTTEGFFRNLEKVQTSDTTTALDNLQGAIQLEKSTHRIDTFG